MPGSAVTIVGLDAAIAALGRLSLDPPALQAFFTGPAKPVVRGYFAAVFASQGALIGKPWAPLRPLTVALRAKRGRGATPIGIDSGAMSRAFVTGSGPEDASGPVGGNAFFYGLGSEKAGWFHNGRRYTTVFGRPVGNRRQPARPIVGETLPQGTMTELERALAAFLSSR